MEREYTWHMQWHGKGGGASPINFWHKAFLIRGLKRSHTPTIMSMELA